ncbi:TetR/AcrR family transcriptional regulator [Polymorphum gilvum]|uniref:Putative transcriptional regulator, TetR family n=1 Tax=Polymorphum gilvum (strain LMG 25793 / CGMCC 1.9160 / SL003B-26A1) TaxID=991905 RepID=F2IXK3_POLGS|nr:TetR/AcrR family transcriptional regulator [Polymorphum gilvum]ADZ71626.1 Putative transcriptional regulator, TetR family [Polymorphum gilvum SL003B-26A1]
MARTRAADYDDKRNAILNRSAALFAAKGIDRAAMSEVARACGVSKALLYHYYASKEALVFDIIHAHLSELDEAIAEADAPDLAPDQRLRALVRRTLEAYRDANDKHKVQLAGVPALPADKAEAIKAIERRIVRRYSDALLAVNPDLNRDRPLLRPVTMSLLGMLNWVYMWFRPDGPISREDYADIAATLVLEGVKAVR